MDIIVGEFEDSETLSMVCRKINKMLNRDVVSPRGLMLCWKNGDPSELDNFRVIVGEIYSSLYVWLNNKDSVDEKPLLDELKELLCELEQISDFENDFTKNTQCANGIDLAAVKLKNLVLRYGG